MGTIPRICAQMRVQPSWFGREFIITSHLIATSTNAPCNAAVAEPRSCGQCCSWPVADTASQYMPADTGTAPAAGDYVPFWNFWPLWTHGQGNSYQTLSLQMHKEDAIALRKVLAVLSWLLVPIQPGLLVRNRCSESVELTSQCIHVVTSIDSCSRDSC